MYKVMISLISYLVMNVQSHSTGDFIMDIEYPCFMLVGEAVILSGCIIYTIQHLLCKIVILVHAFSFKDSLHHLHGVITQVQCS